MATRGSILYFVVSDFGSVDPMYQYSLSYFKEVFAQTVTSAEKADELDKRIAILVEATTRTMFVMICRGLFEQHKVTPYPNPLPPPNLHRNPHAHPNPHPNLEPEPEPEPEP